MKVSESLAPKVILHFEISGAANLSLRWEIRAAKQQILLPDQSYSNKQQEQGFSELWRVSHQSEAGTLSPE